MRGKQRGMTLIGFVIGLIVFCFFAYMGMVLGPGLQRVLRRAQGDELRRRRTPPRTLRQATRSRMLDKQFNVGYVDNVSGKEGQLLREKGGNLIRIEYEVRKAFVYNIDFMGVQVLGPAR
jgi:type II secretory pathway pseudopilin PulG